MQPLDQLKQRLEAVLAPPMNALADALDKIARKLMK